MSKGPGRIRRLGVSAAGLLAVLSSAATAQENEATDLAYAAMGNRGQYLLIVPSENLLIVRRGYDPAGGQRFQLHIFARDVLKALKR